jgi:hypothetical protein
MFVPSSSQTHPDPKFVELVRFSNRVSKKKPAEESKRPNRRSQEVQNVTLEDVDAIHADPLPPLRERDTKALTALFGREDAEEIENDVNSYLNFLFPTPCWEDDPMDFLQ